MYKMILCPVDGSASSTNGMSEAIRLASDQKAALIFLHVLDNTSLTMYPPILEGIYEQIREDGKKILDDAIAAARLQGITAQTKMVEIMTGRVAPIIIEETTTLHADLIVMGTHGRRGLSLALLGSDAASVIGLSPVPVLVVK